MKIKIEKPELTNIYKGGEPMKTEFNNELRSLINRYSIDYSIDNSMDNAIKERINKSNPDSGEMEKKWK